MERFWTVLVATWNGAGLVWIGLCAPALSGGIGNQWANLFLAVALEVGGALSTIEAQPEPQPESKPQRRSGPG
jgi:hypothetical protein